MNEASEKNLVSLHKEKKFTFSSTIILLIAFIALFTAFSLTSKDFFSFSNILSMLKNLAFISITAVGLTVTMVGGEVDISIGSNIGLSSVLVAIFYNMGLNIWICIVLTLLAGLLIGAANGIIITVFRINSIIATIGMMAILQGISFTLTGGKSILIMEDVLGYFGRGMVGKVPFPIIVTAVIFLIFAFILNYTKFGRFIQVVGSNPKVSYLSGIPVKKIKFILLVICGLMATISGLMVASMSAVGMPQHGMGMELAIISSVILGGAALTGGKGSVVGTLIGILIISVIYNGLTILNVSFFYVEIIRGALLILIVAAYEIRTRKKV